ncbi:hypothetical protein P2Q00_12270 [Streptomyces coacervatus]|uniref:hypothetical protein n=1 Tax=Streptomyces coacervatus TaxID=647381 RepID=UPI0023DAEFB4|nr:hypothetical protein [Streptomyces coacervatus]MDF2266207.1 hypothetical protein [Streptomyces coacervatus]
MAAVLGAGVGVVGTLGTACLTYLATRQQAKDQGRVEHGQWLRGRRQLAYEDFLIAYERFAGAATAMEDALEDGRTEGLENLAAGLKEAVETFGNTRSRVAVAGPQFASQSAGQIATLLRGAHRSLLTWRDDLLSGADVSDRSAQLRELQGQIQLAYRDFVRDVRSILEAPPDAGGEKL